MQTSETLARARVKAAEIMARRGEHFRARVVSVSGAVAGREYNPDMFWGHAVRYSDPSAGECLLFWPEGTRKSERSLYMIDGIGYYVAGWQGVGNGSADRAPDGPIYLHPIGSDGMLLMPRRAYVFHTSVVPALNGADY